MAAANLLALIDDIATLLDDISVMSKVAAKKTAGVLGDDLALNADQVQGVRAERELPVVWAVAKGSLLNKVILVPAALLISALLPVLITVFLVIGGLYLCYEGAEKVFHRLFPKDTEAEREARIKQLSDKNVDLVAMEKEKIKGAIRTDFILSAEIIVIALGSIQGADFVTQVGVLCALSVAITVGVYGLVAAIVKMDDLGLYLLKKSLTGNFNSMQRMSGRGLLIAAPILMKALALIGTVAMFLVGGGILTHNVPFIHHLAEQIIHSIQAMPLLVSIAVDGVAGFVAGALVVAVMTVIAKLRGGE
ncbi:DUF808 domain-containing protein [Salinimonas sediminis]|uniref:DUF808 domain-containing protein n=1 Tax=Salinimonas sediminis TaxID=2303538 RepID=A0A346NI09_9ALTE|nr:DUF808 domain-containing protein [Salinimonas sediminis]AXR05166.1 DUF808 domain-containing protein [Salinimonas sediminis]